MTFPPQHGAWAFTIIPLFAAFIVDGVTAVTALFAVAWVAAYPSSYYSTQSFAARIRKRSWTTRAKRELRNGVPWMAITAMPAIALVILRPAIVVPGLVLVLMWLISVVMTSRGKERAFTNDFLLVVMAASAIPLMYWLNNPGEPLPMIIWQISFVTLVYFTGSVIHVKALIREAKNRRWHYGSIAFHVAGLGTAALSPWNLLVFIPTLVRTMVMRPGLAPIRIGLVEILMSLLLVAALALWA